MDKTRNKRKRVKKSASTAAHQMLKRQKHMSEQGLSRADIIATKPAELRVLDDRTKGQEFVYGLNTDGVEELVAGRIKLPPYILKDAMPHIRDLAAIFRRSQPKVKTRGNMRVINLCSWTGVADGIKDPHYPADVASVKVKEHAEKVANGLAVFGKENIKPELLPHFEGLQPLVAYLTGRCGVSGTSGGSSRWWPTLQRYEVATTCDPIFGIFTSSFLACSNNGDFKFHLDSKNSTFGINFSVVVDEEDAEPPVVWPALYLPDRNVVIPAVHGEAIVSMFKHEKHGTRMWHSGERRFAEAAELVAEVDTRKRRISLILADGMGTASWAVKHNQDRFVGSAVVEKRGVTFNINRDATDRNRKIRESVLQALG
ncbi:hypothetical protein BDR26DRAFT_1009735 [Obelidium mucronatum]|nr:hypothetical protein BDR26DRAFT_1009735 [Obelidium mucronatum]